MVIFSSECGLDGEADLPYSVRCGNSSIQSRCINCRTASLVRSGHAGFRIPIRLRSFALAPVYVCMYPRFLRAQGGHGYEF